jgi:predicted metal-dependent peptidase
MRCSNEGKAGDGYLWATSADHERDASRTYGTMRRITSPHRQESKPRSSERGCGRRLMSLERNKKANVSLRLLRRVATFMHDSAELFPSRNRKHGNQSLRYRRFARAGDAILAVDVSGSMTGRFADPAFESIVRDIVDDRVTQAAAIDYRIFRLMPLDEIFEAVRSNSGGTTALKAPISELLQSHARVLLITDDGGVADLNGLAFKVLERRPDALSVVEISS